MWSQRWSAPVLSSLWLVLIAATWAVFAPVQAGGQASFIVVAGNSMEPAFHFGDLVIVHKEARYEIGDIVAYRNLDLGNNVFHRIIGQQRDRFILKGDNNSWIDTYHPGLEEVIGALWLQLPGAGFWVQRIRQPLNMAILAGVLAAGLVLSVMAERSKGRANMNKTSLRERLKNLRLPTFSNPGAPAEPGTNSGFPTESVFFTLGLIAFASLMLALAAFTRSASHNVPEDVPFQHLGFFSYSAAAPPGIYDTGGLTTGAPIFPGITCSVDIRFQYTLVGDQPTDVTGTYSIAARMVEPQSGWQRSLTLQPETPFSGSTFDTHSAFSFCQMQSLVDDMEGQTGFHPGSYTLYITPHVNIKGTLAGRELQSTFEPQLAFHYDRSNFYIVQEDPDVDPFNPSQADVIRNFRETANTLSIFGLGLNVPSLRVLSLIGLLLGLGGMAGLGAYLQNMAAKRPEAFIRAKYASLLADIRDRGLAKPSQLMEVASIDDLAKLAERHNTMILHEARGTSHYYFVDQGSTTYQYVLPAGKGTTDSDQDSHQREA